MASAGARAYDGVWGRAPGGGQGAEAAGVTAGLAEK